jgi:hypothetical protein
MTTETSKSTTTKPPPTPKRIVMECVDPEHWSWKVQFDDEKNASGVVITLTEAWCRITRAILKRNPEQAKQMAVRLVTADYLVDLYERARTEGYDQGQGHGLQEGYERGLQEQPEKFTAYARQDGFAEGYDEGYADAVADQEAKTKFQEEARREGYGEGHFYGRQEGRDHGLRKRFDEGYKKAIKYLEDKPLKIKS